MTFAESIRLTIESVRPTVVLDQDGPLFVHPYRLRAQFRLPGPGSTHSGLIDTGAPLTVLPEAVWKPHEGELHRVSAPPGRVLPQWLQVVAGLGGGLFFCQPAVVPILFFDPELRILKPRRILVKCAHDGGGLKEPLIGLGGNMLESCRLEVEFEANSVGVNEKQPVWLREKPIIHA